jgi:hypothetical protein
MDLLFSVEIGQAMIWRIVIACFKLDIYRMANIYARKQRYDLRA